MLKIKDNVDLNELKKYGFIIDKYGDLVLELSTKDYPMFLKSKISIMIDRTRNINRIGYTTTGIYCFDVELDILFDLIQAGLVEKVGD